MPQALALGQQLSGAAIREEIHGKLLLFLDLK